MEFNLKKDLCFFDVEATGLHVIRDRIIQIAIKKFFADGRPVATYDQLINPGIPISQEAMDITGITPADLRNKPTFIQVAKDIFDFISCYLYHGDKYRWQYFEIECKRYGR